MAGVRPAVWLAAAFAFVLAAGIATTALWPSGVDLQPRHPASAPLAPSPRPIVAQARAATEPRAVPAASPAAATPVQAAPTLEETDPELAGRLRVLEEEAAREAIARRIIAPEQLDAVAAGAASAAADRAAAAEAASDAERQTAADALIEELLVRSEFAATYPQDFPAETRLPQVVKDRLANLGPQDRAEILEELGDQLDSLPTQPSFEVLPTAPAGG